MRNWLKALTAATAGIMAVAVSAPASKAQAIVSTGESFVSVRLLPGVREDNGTRLMGLRLTLAPGWKTYWRTPGSAGIPPQFDWSASENIESLQIMWPRPEVFQSFGLQTIGYSDRVVFPVRVRPVDPARPIGLNMTADLGVCKELCVLEQVSLAEDIDTDTPEIGVREIQRAYRSIPRTGAEAGLTAMECRISGDGGNRQFEAELTFSAPFNEPVVLAEGGKTMWIRNTQTQVDGLRLAVSGEIEMAEGAAWIDRDDLRLTVLDGLFAADIQGCRTSAG